VVKSSFRDIFFIFTKDKEQKNLEQNGGCGQTGFFQLPEHAGNGAQPVHKRVKGNTWRQRDSLENEIGQEQR
jgi:hypothetical protein